MRQSLGTAVFSGMIGVALFGIFLTPVFFFVLMRFGSRKQTSTALAPVYPPLWKDGQPGPQTEIKRAHD
jgi:multidrug efflux pump